tara:strand:+ start:2353 stop:3309 length:957 start_codon:yes stop_codon:yes gene_type:complete
MKILVTGSAGFIGFHLCKKLLEQGEKVYGIDNLNDYYDVNLKKARLEILKKFKNFKFYEIDIANRDLTNKAFKEIKPNKVVNLAAQAGVRYSITNPHVYMDSNLVGFLNIIEECRHNNVDGLVYASSSSVYGKNKKSPSSIKDPVDQPISLYSATKKANELIAHSYSHLYGLNTTGLRYFTVYGPWGRPDMAMYIFTKKITLNEKINVYNNGKMRRDFTFINDIINGTCSAIEKNHACEVFNLGNNKSEKLMDIIATIEESLNKKAKINFLPMQPGDVKQSYADITESIEKLRYSPETSIIDGIPQFIDWYKKYHKSK